MPWLVPSRPYLGHWHIGIDSNPHTDKLVKMRPLEVRRITYLPHVDRHHTAFPDYPGCVVFSGPLSQHPQDRVRENSTKSRTRFMAHYFFLTPLYKVLKQRWIGMVFR